MAGEQNHQPVGSIAAATRISFALNFDKFQGVTQGEGPNAHRVTIRQSHLTQLDLWRIRKIIHALWPHGYRTIKVGTFTVIELASPNIPPDPVGQAWHRITPEYLEKDLPRPAHHTSTGVTYDTPDGKWAPSK